jgi:hypothetical protein
LATLWWAGVDIPVSFETFRPPPASLVGSDGLQLVSMAWTEREYRYGIAQYRDDRTSYMLPPASTGVSFSETRNLVRASWETVPSIMDGVALDLQADTADGVRLIVVEASPSWLATTGATSLAFDVSPPGFDPAWRVDTSGPYHRALVTWRNGIVPHDIDYLQAQVFEDVNGAVARTAPARRLRDPMVRHGVRPPTF